MKFIWLKESFDKLTIIKDWLIGSFKAKIRNIITE